MSGQRKKGPVRVTLIMASFGYKEADEDDIDFMTVVRQIEHQNGVVIEIDVQNNCLDICGFTKGSTVKAIAGICSAVKLDAGGAKVWHPSVLMAPVMVGKTGYKALLAMSPQGARPYMSPEAGPLASSEEYRELVAKWHSDFRDKVFQAVKNIRKTPSEMRMRVQLGTLLLQEWKKSATDYSYSSLENVIKRLGVRGTFSFSQMLSKAQLAHNLLAKIYASPDKFEPSNTRIGNLEWVKPKHTLILTTSSLKVETDVIHVKENDNKADFRLGPAKGYRRERRSRAVEIATSCPEHKYDWNLAVHTRVPVASLPFSHDDIAEHSKFKRRKDPNEFPEIRMRRQFAETFKVEQITGKASWVFLIKNSPYAIEVAIYNVLAAAAPDADNLAEGGCGVDFFRPGWDELLSARNVAAGVRELSEDCREIFPLWEKKETDKDGVEAFVRRAAEIHALVSNMDDDKPQPTVSVVQTVVPEVEAKVEANVKAKAEEKAEEKVEAKVEEKVEAKVEEEDLLLSWD